MRKLLMICFCCFLLCSLKAQVTLQPNIPTTGLMQKKQLWNVLMVNGNAEALDGKLMLVLIDRRTGQELFTARSGIINVPKGPKLLNDVILNPIQYNYTSSLFNGRLQDLLPIGSYTACYTFKAKEELLSEECIAIDIEPLSPPMLIFPTDSAKLDAMPAQFTWMPPAPMQLFGKLNYQVIIAEVKSGQQAAEALQENIPVFFENNLFSNVLNYPSSAKGFEKGKNYAWHVIAQDGTTYAAKTETWVFTINEQAKEQKAVSNTYFLINDANGVYELNSDSIAVKFNSYEGAFEAQFDILNKNDKIIKQYKAALQVGDNYIKIPFDRKKYKEAFYSLKLKDFTGKIHSIRIAVNKNEHKMFSN
jgi:hypothetical protein